MSILDINEAKFDAADEAAKNYINCFGRCEKLATRILKSLYNKPCAESGDFVVRFHRTNSLGSSYERTIRVHKTTTKTINQESIRQVAKEIYSQYKAYTQLELYYKAVRFYPSL